jgi:Nitrous oxidase accessory protein
MRQFISTAILFLALIFSNALYARVYYVNINYTGSTENGNSWATPFKKLDPAIAAATDGDEIWVAKGTYVAPAPGYVIDKELSIYGGFTGTETSTYARDLELNKTILKGNLESSNNLNIFNLKQNKLFVLDGLDMTEFGVAVLSQYDYITNSANILPGDIYKLTLNNCDAYLGGSIAVLGTTTDMQIRNSTFNTIRSTAFNLSNNELPPSTIKFENSIFNGAGGSTLIYTQNAQLDVIGCQISHFTTTIFPFYLSKDMTFKDCEFKDNTSTLIYCTDNPANISFDECIFDGFGNSNTLINVSNNLPSIKFKNTTFKNGVNCYQIAYDLKNLELDNVTISNSAFYYEIFRNIKTIKIKNSNIDGITSITNYGRFIETSGSIDIDNLTYKNCSIAFIVQLQDTARTNISNSIFENNTIQADANYISLMQLKGTVEIANCTVSNNTYLWGSSRPNNSIITITNGNVNVIDSKFENNKTNYQAGIFYIMLNGGFNKNIVFENSIFNNNDNTAFDIGNYFNNAGAIYFYSYDMYQIWKLKNCTFLSNKSNGSGAAYLNVPESEIENCIFEQNQSLSSNTYADASALNLQINSTGAKKTSISRCQFKNNSSTQTASTLIVRSNYGYAKINQCIFQNNTSSKGTSALDIDGGSYDVYNTLFDSNIAATANKGLFNRGTTAQAVNFYNCTFVKNHASGAGLFTGLYPNIITNSIFWGNGNEAPIKLNPYYHISLVNVSNSLVEGGLAPGTNIFDSNPQFVDFAGGNYRLSCQSPLINKGNNALGVSLFDLDGTARIFSDTIDIGAYETHIDPAFVNSIPAPSFTIPVSVCKGELFTPINTTANSSNYTYRWDFGNGQTSSQFAPAYSFDLPGQYTIQLTGSNFCGQSNTTSKQITVRANNAPTITTVSVVCPGDEQTYTTNATCQNIVWTVTGGSIQSGQGTTSIHVLWGNGATGNGKIELLATGCGTAACEIPVSVEVPIVPVNFSLTGPNIVCQGSFAHYGTVNKDKSPATLYTWAVKGGTISSNTNRDYNLTDIDVSWSTSATEGVVYLTTYNELLKCGRLDSFKVNLRPLYKISGNTEVCPNTSVAYQVTPAVGLMNWQVTGPGNSITNGSSANASWGSIAGIYKVTAVPQDLTLACNTQDTFLVHVNAKPIITGITGETEIATNSIDVYTAQVNTSTNDVNFNWVSPGGTIVSSYSNTATIQRNNFSPANISLSVTTKQGACPSDPFIIHVKKLFDYTITGADSVCIGTSASYTANENPDQTATYAWTNIQDGTSYSGTTITPTFTYVGMQQLQLKVTSNGREFIVRKYVYVKSTQSNISIEGPITIDPAGLQTAVYTIKNPANVGYALTIVGGIQQSKVGNQVTIKWGGTEPFSIRVQDIFTAPKCNGVPVTLAVKKAALLSSGISVGGPACLNSRIDYSFAGDEFTKNISWSINGGGTLTNASQNVAAVEWNQTGSHVLTLTYERFGLQTIQLPIVVNALPTPEINTGTICGTDAFNLSTTQNYVQYNWYLKDSNVPFSTQATPPIVSEGLYTVKVTDNNGCVNASSQYIKQVPLPKARVFTLDNTVLCKDAAGGTTAIKLSTFEGQDYKYQWYINNTTIAGATTFNYEVAQPLSQENYYAYKVQVSLGTCVQYSDVKNIIIQSCGSGGSSGGGGGGTGGGGIGVCTDPPISFSVDPTSFCQPFKFIVDPSITSGTGLGWDFGDGSTASGLNPTKEYTNADAGSYNVQLTKGCRYYTTPVKVLARALFKLDEPGCVGTQVTFNEFSINYPGNSITRWVWNFGDGSGDIPFNTAGSRDGNHTYANAGTYIVTLKVYAKNDQNIECEFITSNTYEINPSPITDYIITPPSCSGNTYKFVQNTNFGKNGAGPVKWTFSNGETSVNDTTLQQFAVGNQTIKLNATDRLGCSNTKSGLLVVSAPAQIGKITVPIKDTLLCNGKTVTLTSPVNVGGTTYQWNKDGAIIDAGTNQTYVVTAPGNYSVSYWASSTCNTTTAAVRVNNFTVPNLISGEKLNCVGGTVTLRGNLSATDYSYTWKHGTDTLRNKTVDLVLNNVTATDAGNYQLTVTQPATSCYVTLPVYTIQVNANPAKPVINASAVNICNNTSVLVNTPTIKSGKTFEWYQNTIKLSGIDTVITSGLLKNDATYFVTVKETATGCSTSSDNLTVKVAPAINVVISGDTVLCEQIATELTSSLEGKDFTFQWLKNNQPTGGDFSKLSFTNIVKADSGVYKLRVTSKGTTNLTGCIAFSNNKTIKVKPTAATPIITGFDEFCSGNTVTLTTNLSSNIVWNTGATSPSITVSSGGIYSVTSTNIVSGCKVTTSKTLIQNPIPDLNFVPSGEYARCGTNKIAFEGLNNYPIQKWYVNGQLFSTNKIIYPTQSGKYTVTVTTAKGCTAVSDTMIINAQECACYVTNTNNSGDGSLREAINCSNDKPGKDAIRFAIPGTGPFTIQPTTPLPAITDSVFVDGFSQSGDGVYNIIIEGTKIITSKAIVLKDNLSNVKISGITFVNFNTGVDLSSGTFNNTIEKNIFTANAYTGVLLNVGANNNTIRNNQFTGGSSAILLYSNANHNRIQSNTITSAINAIQFKGGSKNTVQSNTISGSLQNGILLENAPGNIIVSDTIGASLNNGILVALGSDSTKIDANYIGVKSTGTIIANLQNGVYVVPNVMSTIISNNTISGNTLSGLAIEGKNTSIRGNYIGTNAIGANVPNAAYGIYATGENTTIAANIISNNGKYGIYIKDKSPVINNTVVNNISGGIYVLGTQNSISKNIITNTTTTVKAINLHASVIPAGNLNKQPAVFTGYRRATSGGIIIRGTSTTAGDTVELFYNNNKPQQALLFAGSTKADASGNWEIEIPQGAAFNPNQKNLYVNTARSTANNTSELSTPFLTGCFSCVCTVTNANDSGLGSFRAVIDSANVGGCLTINFKIPSDTIQLLSAVSPIKVPVKIVAPYPGDTSIFIKGSNTFNGLVVNNDGVQIINLGFTQFKKAIVLNSDYNIVRSVTVLNTKQPIAIAGNNSRVFSSAINTTWENDASTFKADTLVYVTGSGNLIGGTGVDNKITNGKTGVLVNGGTANRILNNAIYNTTQAIALLNNGNTTYTKPAGMVGSINGNTASIQGTAKPYDKIQIFSSTYVSEQATGFVVEVTADATGNWTVIIPSNKVDINQNNYFVATATSTTGNTSQLSTPIRVGNYVQVCYVTNTKDLGDGSLREAVNCANIAGTNPNGLAARIEFQLPATPNVITLASGLVITNTYGVEVNARTIPVTVKTNNTALNCFTWATNNFKVKHLTFENFSNALYCTGQNAVIDSNNFVINKNAIYVNAADSIKQQTITNNYFGGGASSINSVRGSLIVTNNAFGVSQSGTASPITGYGISAARARSVVITNNTFANISQTVSATSPAIANGYVLSIENAISTVSNNTITGKVATALPAIRLYANKNSTVSSNKITNAYEGILFDRCNGVLVSQNALASVSNRGFNLVKSTGITLTQNTVVGLVAGKNPIDLNLPTTDASNNKKVTPVILTSTYHDGQLFLIGQAEKFDEVEVFYSNTDKRDLVKYITKSNSDSTGTWIVSFPISAKRSDTLFFRAVATKNLLQSSEASVTFNPDLKICLVTTKLDAGAGSLRDAIDQANLNQCNLIQFDIPGSGVAGISTTSELPAIITPLLIIDGTSQHGYLKGSPTVDLINNNAVNGFNGQGGNQLDIYGMKITNFDVAINILNSKIVNTNDNIIEDATDIGIKVKTTGFIYGNIANNSIKSQTPYNIGVSLDGTAKMSIDKNTIINFSTIGISAKGNNQKITNNTLRASNNTTSVGIDVATSSSMFIQGDTIVHAGIGIKVNNGNTNTIISNVIGKTDSISKARNYIVNIVGVSITASYNSAVSSNTIAVTKNAITVTNTKGYLINSNTSKKAETAVYLSNASNGEVNNNTIDSAQIGMQFDGSHGVAVYNNLITRSLTYGIILNTGSDTCRLTANLIGARYYGDPTYAEGAGILVKSSNNYIGPDDEFGLGNYIKQNKKGGVIVENGTKNAIKYNFFYNNDVTKGKPTAYAIELRNGGNGNKLKPSITSHKWIAGKLHVYGTNNNVSGDSIHLYLGTGGYEEASQFLGFATSTLAGNWDITVDTAISNYIPARTTWYVVATATNINRNTSPLSDMYILGDCYITSLKDTTDNQYPLPNTMRMAMKCANGQANPVGVYFNVAQGGPKEVKLQKKMLDLNNGYGVYFNGKNIPDGVVAGMNAQKLSGASWTIAATNAKSTIANFQIVNASDGLEVLSDSILLQKMRFDKITGTGILVSNKRIIVDSCVFDSLSIGVVPAANAIHTVLSGNTFNGAKQGVLAVNTDSLTIQKNTFNNNGVSTGIDINGSTHAAIFTNSFNSKYALAKSITWDNSKGVIEDNIFTADSVNNPLSISNTTQVLVTKNIFKDTAEVYLALTNSSHAVITNNTFTVATQNSIKTTNVAHTTILNNTVSKARNDAFNLETSSTVFVSKNIVRNVRYTSRTDSALCINIHKGQSVLQSNLGKPEPKNLSYEVKAGSDRRIGIFVKGIAEPGDSIELFFSDSISASMNSYVVNAFAHADSSGRWFVKIPREFYHKDTVTWYHVVAVAIDADSNTSKTSSVLHIPPSPTKIYVLNTYNAGPNSLRQALLDVTYSDLYSKVIFSINTPTRRAGPYNIKIDSLLDPVYSYQGFEMDGITQKVFAPFPGDQRILVNGQKIQNNFGLDITDSSDACLLKNMWITNAKNGMRISNNKNKIEKFYFINTDSSNVAQLDTALVIQSNENEIKNIGISDYKLGVLFQNQIGKNKFTESAIDSTVIGMALKDSSYLNYIANNTFTNTTQHSVLIDSAAADNKLEKNIFGKQNKGISGNAITIRNSSNQTVVTNRISYFNENVAQSTASSAIVIEGVSSNNFVYNNRIGLDSLGTTVHTANVRGVTIQKTVVGQPSRNSIVGNEINGTMRVPIHISYSSEDLISENIIGGDSTRKIFGIDTSAIFVSNSMNEQINDNTILGYSQYGIELLTSSGIQMHRNTIYSKTTLNKAINIHSESSTIVSNGNIVTPNITSGILTDINTIKLTGTAMPGAIVEVYQSVKDTLQSIDYVDKAFASSTGAWELSVPKTFFSYATQNTFTAQNHFNNNSSELGTTFTPDPILCQLQNNPAIKIIEPRYTPCPGPDFNIDPTALDIDLTYKWTAPSLTSPVNTKIIQIADTTENLTLQVKDNFGCTLTRTTDVVFKAKPIDPNFIISSNVYAGDTVVLVDISFPVPDTYTWYSSPGVTVLRSSATASDSLIGEDGNVYPKGVRFIEFILPDSGSYSIRQTSLKDGCFVDQTKDLNAIDKNVNVPNPYYVAPIIESIYAYPNPAAANEDVFVTLSVATKDSVTLSLISIDGVELGNTKLGGRLDYNLQLLGTAGNPLFENNLAAGEYILKLVTAKNEGIVFKIIIGAAR